MTGQHDRSVIFPTVELRNAHAHDNWENIWKINSVINADFSLFVFIEAWMCKVLYI